METPFIQEFEITGMFGYKDIRIDFKHPILILIGENGYGKTTILNAINYTIKGRYKELLDIKFETIKIKIGDNTYQFDHDQLEAYYESIHEDERRSSLVEYLKNNLSGSEFDALCAAVLRNQKISYKDFPSSVIQRFPRQMIEAELENYLINERRFSVFMSLRNKIQSYNYNIMFEPTYRRVEADLGEGFINSRPERRRILRRIDDDDERSQSYAAKIIRFGMSDVEDIIRKVTEKIQTSSLQGFAKVSGDMIRQLLNVQSNVSVDHVNLDEKSIRIILGRTGNNLTDEERQQFIDQIDKGELEKNPYLNYFLEQLYEVYQSLEQYDTAIKQFTKVCNGYFTDKKFVYDESRVTLNIYRYKENLILYDDNNIVKLSNLSSGEKQIVSLFAQIYLDIDKQFVMLLDEPELSLSIFWQERLLDDIYNSGRCAFLLAVTHSPFIFRSNSMRQYVVGMQEFLSDGNKNERER